MRFVRSSIKLPSLSGLVPSSDAISSRFRPRPIGGIMGPCPKSA
jgi:hypothetical protein